MVNTSSVIFHRVEEFEDTKRVIIIRKSKKERTTERPRKNDKRTNKIKDRTGCIFSLYVYFQLKEK
jgi:hypothetical protein